MALSVSVVLFVLLRPVEAGSNPEASSSWVAANGLNSPLSVQHNDLINFRSPRILCMVRRQNAGLAAEQTTDHVVKHLPSHMSIHC